MPKIRVGAINREGVENIVKSLESLSRAGFTVAPDFELQKHVYSELGVPTEGIQETPPGLGVLED